MEIINHELQKNKNLHPTQRNHCMPVHDWEDCLIHHHPLTDHLTRSLGSGGERDANSSAIVRVLRARIITRIKSKVLPDFRGPPHIAGGLDGLLHTPVTGALHLRLEKRPCSSTCQSIKRLVAEQNFFPQRMKHNRK